MLAVPEPLRTGLPKPGEFRELLTSAVASVEQARIDAGSAIGGLVSGEAEELHRVALAVQRAELSFDLFLQVRNKVVQAYQEVMRMQV